MKYLYTFPQRANFCDELVSIDAKRARGEFEYELMDTGIFHQNEYFDVFVEYAKEAPESFIIAITVWNRGPQRATLHVLPTIWFRNEWSWRADAARPSLSGVSTAIILPSLSPDATTPARILELGKAAAATERPLKAQSAIGGA